MNAISKPENHIDLAMQQMDRVDEALNLVVQLTHDALDTMDDHHSVGSRICRLLDTFDTAREHVDIVRQQLVEERFNQ